MNFSKKTAILFKIFISKVSWITFILACYFGFKNFSIKSTLIGIIISIALFHLMFFFSGKFIILKGLPILTVTLFLGNKNCK